MPYLEKKWDTGLVIEIEKVYTEKYYEKLTRAPKQTPTTESQKEVNKRESIKKLRRLLNKNFGFGDAHIILTYDPSCRPDTKEKARDDLEKFHRAMHRRYRKKEISYKYITASEYGKNTIHHHLIVNKADIATLQSCWSKGGIHIYPLYRSGQYDKLADYLIKQTDKTFSDPQRRIYGKRWNQSKNLKIPKPKVKIVNAQSWLQDPRIPKGYILENPPLTGINEKGYPYQFYTLRKVNFFEA